MTDSITFDKTTLRKRFTLRTTGPDGKYFETQLPREVVERESQHLNLTIEEFKANYELEALYGNFDGIYFRFVPKNTERSTP